MDCSTSEKDLVLMNINSLWKTSLVEDNDPEKATTEALQVQHDEQNRSHDRTECLDAKVRVQETGTSSGTFVKSPMSEQSDFLSVRQRVAEIEKCQRSHSERSSPQSCVPKPSSISKCEPSSVAGTHVVGQPVEGLSLPDSTRCCGGNRSDDACAVDRVSHRVWQSQNGSALSGGIRRPSLDELRGEPLRAESKGRTHEVHSLHSSQDRGRREPTRGPSSEQAQGAQVEAINLRTAKDPGDFRAIYGRSVDHLRDRTGGRIAASTVHQRAAHERDRGHSASGGHPSSAADSEHECIHRDHECLQGEVVRELKDDEQDRLREEILSAKMLQSPDRYEFDFHASKIPETFARQCRKLTQQFRQELADVMKTVRPKGKKSMFFEVMCSSDSELTRQCHSMGYLARRFGLAEGDLQSRIGRRNLFAHLVADCPMHLWYAPICKPWCKWSLFNMNRSEESFDRIMQERFENLWQVSLATVLFEYQVQHERHFHMEQPEGSALLHLPMLGKILAVAKPCVFDMCNVGHLREPITQTPIRKRLVVHTTSGTLRENLDKRFCRGDHEHHIIAGSTRINSEVVAVSKFTERYPRKFARQIIQLLSHGRQKPCWLLTADEEGEDDHPTKRRRVDQKRSPWQITLRDPNLSWSHILMAADAIAPRVGVSVIETGDLLEAVQTLCPNHIVRHLVMCIGTDRMLGPNKRLSPGEAPFRRMICIRRRFEDHETETEWEPWERLSFRKLRRNCTPARLNVTIFARPRYEPLPENRGHLGSEVQVPRDAEHTPESNPEIRRSHREKPETPPDREIIDLASQKHGPLMQALRTDEQAWLLKLHRNLGHPGSQKLMTFCRQLQCEERVIKAIPDLKCSTCQETKGPTIPRPSAIHEDHDFGDVVSMDGIEWTNQGGQKFHFFHFVDQSTSFQAAIIAPSRRTSDAIDAVCRGWLNWAGPPGMLVLDSASEFCTEEFQEFAQKHNIKLRIIPPEAHWLNSRAERHGGILQNMLTKMDHEQTIESYENLERALGVATSTKNQWSRHRGYPPELLVFGKLRKQPGSNSSDTEMSSHLLAQTELPEGARFREELALRDRARKAFVQSDNDASLRRAISQRSRPHRGIYESGEWVMLWRNVGKWSGPMKVIVQDLKQQVVWLSFGSKLFRAAPEHVRPLSAVEEVHRPQNPVGVAPEVERLPPQVIDLCPDLPPMRSSEEFPESMPVPRTERTSSCDQPDIEPSAPSRSESLVPSIPENPFEDSMSYSPEFEPQDIPVPEDDELVCEGCVLETDHAWHYEIEVNARDIQHWRQADPQEIPTLLVTNAKKQRVEVQMSKLKPEDKVLFQKAKENEIQSWLDTGTVCKILRNKLPRESILRCRWVLTWKDTETNAHLTNQNPSSTNRKAKARLVILGYEDPMLSEVERDSPTLTKLARMLIMQYAASSHWEIGSFDVKTAFLRGKVDDNRLLGLEPPEEMRKMLGLKDAEVCRLLKGAYGLAAAPLLWFKEFRAGLLRLNFIQSPFDPCLFILPDANGQPQGMVGIHVDDGLYCGNAKFHEVIQQLEQQYPFGSRKKKNFVFTGLQINQNQDFSIEIDQTQYVKDIDPIRIAPERRKEPQATVSEEERQQLRALIGSLQYAATNTRPDLGSRLSFLQSKINSACIETLLDGNRTLHEAKAHSDVKLRIQPIALQDVRFVSFSDAAFASEKTKSSHQGMMLMTAHKCIGENKSSVVNPILWSSKKIQKVAVSTLSAEAMALASAVDILAWARLFWSWMLNINSAWKLGDQTLLKLPPAFHALFDDDVEENNESITRTPKILEEQSPTESYLNTDCKSLYDLVSRHAPPSCGEFRTLLQAKLIKEHLATGVILRWVPSGAQIADTLTKIMDSTVLRECLRLGRYTLQDEQEILRHRADARTRIRWLQGNAEKAKSLCMNSE